MDEDLDSSDGDDIQTNELIKSLAALKNSCEKPVHHDSTILNKSTSEEFTLKNSNTNVAKRARSKRKLITPRKKMKIGEENSTMQTSQPESENDLCISLDSHCSDDSTDGEELTIVEKKTRKRSKQTTDVPEELIELILKSGIDDFLEEKATERKLTATHVKNIIKQIITDENVLQMVKNAVLNKPWNIFEPKLTRAKTKELYVKQMQENGEDMSMHQFFHNPMPSTRSLITTEFPEEDDDEEYQPGLDEQVFSDDESGLSKFGSPTMSLTPNSSITSNTPKSLLSKTPRHFLSVPTGMKAVQRSLDFNKHSSEQIGNRTRSKYPMTDTPIEYLESLFIPPDITPDMYGGDDCDEVYKQFCIDLFKPQDDIPEDHDDDPQVDPEYNLLKDAEEEATNTIDRREEMRGDKSVKITKREHKDLIGDFHDIFYEENRLQFQGETCFYTEDIADCSQLDVSEHVSSQAAPLEGNLTTYTDFTNEILLSEVTGIKIGDFDPSACKPQQTPVVEALENENPVITIEYMISMFSKEQIKILEYQLSLHAQLLTSVVLNTDQKEGMGFMVSGATNMLNEMKRSGNESRGVTWEAPSLFHTSNLDAAIETVQQFIKERNKQPYKEELSSKYERNPSKRGDMKPLNENNPENKKWQYRNDNRRLEHYPPWLMNIYMRSKAFPFPEYLPSGLFHGNIYTVRRGYKRSEYW